MHYNLNLIILILYLLLIIFAVVGYGLFLNRLIGEKTFSTNLGYLGLLGLFFLTLYSYISNIIVPHGIYHNTLILFFGILFFFKFFKSEVGLKNKISEIKLLLTVFLLLLSGLFIQKNHDDFFYYHLPYTYYLTQHSLIFGVGQFGHGFRTPSSIFYVNSMFYLPFAKNYLLNIYYLLALGFSNIILIKNSLSISYKKNLLDKRSFINFISIFSLLFINIFFYRLSEHGTDRSAQIFVIILVIELLSLNYLTKLKLVNLKIIYLLSALIISIKAFYILYVIFFIPLFYQVFKAKKKFKKTLKFLIMNRFFWLFLILLCFVSFSNFTNTGCFLYPVSSTCIDNLIWSIPKEQVVNMSNWYELWSKAGAGPNFRVDAPENYISNLNWVGNWLDEYFFNKISDLILGIVILIVIVLSIFRINIFKITVVEKNNFIRLVYLAILIIFIEWFYNHPALRYGGYCLIVLIIFIPICIKLSAQKIETKKFYNYCVILITLGFLIFNGRNFHRISNEIQKYNYKPIEIAFYKIESSGYRVEKKMSEIIREFNRCKNQEINCDDLNLKIAIKYGKLIFIR